MHVKYLFGLIPTFFVAYRAKCVIIVLKIDAGEEMIK
nr:MAG TPA: hypothetical protein [Caudoviricetes sp.]